MLNEKALVSVIVPVYKVEEYLEDCVYSIKNQTYKNLEIILVDDGSPDNCPKICDELSLKDERIKVVHKKNGGLSEARNYGIDVATGDYIYCVDSDDRIEHNAIQMAVEKAEEENADIVITTMRRAINKFDVVVGNNEEMFKEIFNRYCWEAWGKLIHKDVIKGMKYPVGKLFEDLGYVPYAVLRANKIVLMDNGLYLYTVREESIMGKANTTLSPDLVDIVEDVFAYVNNNHSSLKEFFFSFSVGFLLSKSKSIENIKNETNSKFLSRVQAYFKNNIKLLLTCGMIGKRKKVTAIVFMLFKKII